MQTELHLHVFQNKTLPVFTIAEALHLTIMKGGGWSEKEEINTWIMTKRASREKKQYEVYKVVGVVTPILI